MKPKEKAKEEKIVIQNPSTGETWYKNISHHFSPAPLLDNQNKL